ncbi:MAG: hypothetical protein ACI8PQ_003299 [Planctomycetota bacterium]
MTGDPDSLATCFVVTGVLDELPVTNLDEVASGLTAVVEAVPVDRIDPDVLSEAGDEDLVVPGLVVTSDPEGNIDAHVAVSAVASPVVASAVAAVIAAAPGAPAGTADPGATTINGDLGRAGRPGGVRLGSTGCCLGCPEGQFGLLGTGRAHGEGTDGEEKRGEEEVRFHDGPAWLLAADLGDSKSFNAGSVPGSTSGVMDSRKSLQGRCLVGIARRCLIPGSPR